MQVVRYAESVAANANAAKADEGYITQCHAQGLYPLTDYPHNVHFLAWAAAMRGMSRMALEASRKVADKVPQDGPYNTDGAKQARAELKAVNRCLEDRSLAEVGVGFSTAQRLLTIAQQVLTGEIKAGEGDYDEAVAHLERAVRLEDSHLYNEPPDWFQPVRHNLGAVLLEAGRLVEAEVVYWQDLKKNRDNGFALYGVWQALKAQGGTDEAAEVEVRFEKAWADADVKLASSRY